MNICKKCLYMDNHPLGIIFDEDGVCSGCRIHEEKDQLDWDDRFKELKKLVFSYKGKNDYDCIIPISGGRDSFYILEVCINKLHLKPLGVTYNHGFNTPEGLNNLATLKNTFDLDVYQLNPNPNVIKKITRCTLNQLGSVYWHVLAGQSVLPVQLALSKKIPLIIWGAHQGLEQVGMFSHEHAVEMTRRFREDHDLMGIEANDLIKPYNNLRKSDLYNYLYPPFSDLIQGKVRGIYLGNYIRWDTFAQHKDMIEKYNYLGRKSSRTFYQYDNPDCYVYNSIHDILKLLKCGYGKSRDQLVREIRFGRITRVDAIKLLEEYEQNDPDNVEQFINWLGIKPSMLSFVLNKHRSKIFWEETEPNKYKRKENTFSARELRQKYLSDEKEPIDAAMFEIGAPLDKQDYPESYVQIATGVRPPKIDEEIRIEI